jgi:hypothetical protein
MAEYRELGRAVPRRDEVRRRKVLYYFKRRTPCNFSP